MGRRWGILVLSVMLLTGTLVAQEPPNAEPTADVSIVTPEATQAPVESQTPEATVPALPTDDPMLSPTSTFTSLPTLTETLTSTVETQTFPTSTSENLTQVPSPSPVLSAEPILTPIVSDTFDQVDSVTWSFGSGWGYHTAATGQALRVYNSSAPVTWNNTPLADIAVEAQFVVDYGTAVLSVRQSETGAYAVSLDKMGFVMLMRAGEIQGQAQVSASAVDQWRTIRLSAIDNTVRVSVDNILLMTYEDPTPLPAGDVSFHAVFGPLPADYGTPYPPVNTLLGDNVVISVPSGEVVPTVTATSTESPTLTETTLPSSTPSMTWTPTPTLSPQDPQLGVLFSDDFDTGDLTSWTLSQGWSLASNGDDYLLFASTANETAVLNQKALANVAAQARFSISTGSVLLAVRQSTSGQYTAEVDTEGQVSLYKGTELLGTALISSPDGQWRILRISAIGDIVRVSIDTETIITVQDALPLPEGNIVIASGANPTTLFIDDVSVLVPLDELPLVDVENLNLVFSDDFESGDLSAWQLDGGWLSVQTQTGQALQASANPAQLKDYQLLDTVLQLRTMLNTNPVRLTVRESEEGNYALVLRPEGILELYRGTEQLAVQTLESFAATEWHTISFSAINAQVMIAVDNVNVLAFQDTQSLMAGGISLAIEASTTTATTLFDDVQVWTEPKNNEITAEPPLSILVSDNFDSSTLREWMFTANWTEGLSQASKAVETHQTRQVLPVLNDTLYNGVLETTVEIYAGAVYLRMRESEAGYYELRFETSGLISLYRSDVLLQAATVRAFDPLEWRSARFSIIENTIRVSIDGVEVMVVLDDDPLPAGRTSLLSVLTQDPATVLRVDEIVLYTPMEQSEDVALRVAEITAEGGEDTSIDMMDTPPMMDMNQLAASCSFTRESTPPGINTQGISVPLQGLIVYSFWEGAINGVPTSRDGRREIRIKTPDGMTPVTMAQLDSADVTYNIGQRIIGSEGTEETAPAISPDGNRIVFVSDCDGNNEIYVADFRADVPVDRLVIQLTNTDSPVINTLPKWSPDSTRIVFQSNRDGAGWKLYIMDSFDRTTVDDPVPLIGTDRNGDNLRRLTNNALTVMEDTPAWSPDGRLVAYAARGCEVGDSTYNIYKGDAYGTKTSCGISNRVIALAGDDMLPAWSPDKRFIAFTNEATGNSRIHLTSSSNIFDTTSNPDDISLSFLTSGPFSLAVDLTESMPTPGYYATAPIWSPGGGSIAFVSNMPEGGSTAKMFIINLRIDKHVISGSALPSNDYVVTSYNATNWVTNPMSASGVGIGYGGLDWAQGAECSVSSRSDKFREDSLLKDVTGKDKFMQLKCLVVYRGLILAGFYNESSSNSYRSLDDLAYDFNLDAINVPPNHRYLYARTMVNGILDVTGGLAILPDRDKEQYKLASKPGAAYFNNFGGSIGQLKFGWLCNSCTLTADQEYNKLYVVRNKLTDKYCSKDERATNEGLPPDQKICYSVWEGAYYLYDPLAEWMNVQIDAAYTSFQVNDGDYFFYVGHTYHDFLPYIYMAIHDVVYRDPNYTNPSNKDGYHPNQDPFARFTMAKTVTVCTAGYVMQINSSTGLPEPVCAATPPPVAVEVGSQTNLQPIRDIDNEVCATLFDYYIMQLEEFTTVDYMTTNNSRHVQVLRTEFANGGAKRVKVKGGDYIYYTLQDMEAIDPEFSILTEENPTTSIPLIEQRWEITGYTWITFSFQAPDYWFGRDDANYPLVQLSGNVSATRSLWAGKGIEIPPTKDATNKYIACP